MTSSPSWRTGHRGGECGTCGGVFAPPVDVVSLLFLVPVGGSGEDEAFERRDACLACFEQGGTADAFSWWRYTVVPPEEKKAAFDLEMAREFLLRLLREDGEERASLRYLLVLLLLRKRIVRVEDQFHDAERGEIMTLRLPPDETVFEIVCPELDEAETDSLREQIGQLFDLGD